MRVNALSSLVLGFGVCLASSNAMAFFSSAQNGSTGNSTQTQVASLVSTCAAGDIGRITTATGTPARCGIAAFTDEAHEDAVELSEFTDERATLCSIVNEGTVNAIDNNCAEEDLSYNTLTEDGFFGLVKLVKLLFKPVGASNWSWVVKRIGSRHAARMDQYCAANGAITSLVAWISVPAKRRICNSASAYGYCNSTFSTSTMPECNADCRVLDDQLCDRGDTGTCELEENTITCPSTYAGIAGYCSTSHSGCDALACETMVSGVCGLFPPEERFTDLAE